MAGGRHVGRRLHGLSDHGLLYWKGNVVFLEPMIPVSTFEKKQSFEIPIAKPASAGGATTLYPTRMVASWLEETETID